MLKYYSDAEYGSQCLRDINLFPHYNPYKSWDTYKMIKIIRNSDRNSYVLDVGCNQSPILVMLRRLGFSNLYGCDLTLKTKYPISILKFAGSFYKRDYKPILEMYENKTYRLSIQNLENTNYPNKIFDYITSLSVIEHGVNLSRYYMEMNRILKKGGYLLTSTDYWPTKIVNTKKAISCNTADNIFDRYEIEEMLHIAEQNGFALTEPLDYTYREKVVHWKLTGLDYTFIFFALKKERDI